MAASAGENSKESASSLARLAPLQAVLFDIDGTLCDSDPFHYLAFCEMLLEIGYNGGVPVDEEWFVKTISGKHNDDLVSVFFPNDHERGVKFLDDKEALFRRLAKEQLKPLNGLYKLRKWIEDRGLKRAAVTNAPRENAELCINQLGLADFFDALILGSDCKHAKPYPDPYLKALEVLNVSKDHTFVFEDSVSGIKAGVAAEMSVVGLANRNPSELLMEANPTFLIKDYEDPKLWAALEEIDKMSRTEKKTIA
ncbi:haloacid dehalogenase-like hydrolase domain-containing protein Sgpp isoform X2 [Nicotiana sylvestris]|uniref:Haloacid dehalogenase-like hydrolase domain-containing protein Sgpp isoform X2 n=1 Tax=Nicotiana sylvestris TaxID=4096 RepID=A0A1U7Y177_NICSY|nr:PREDICTED: haloacid dehalogenase-like hydrolase domain-containing protein Sgpp isoform X2 [Nicotiana sylvestris]